MVARERRVVHARGQEGAGTLERVSCEDPARPRQRGLPRLALVVDTCDPDERDALVGFGAIEERRDRSTAPGGRADQSEVVWIRVAGALEEVSAHRARELCERIERHLLRRADAARHADRPGARHLLAIRRSRSHEKLIGGRDERIGRQIGEIGEEPGVEAWTEHPAQRWCRASVEPAERHLANEPACRRGSERLCGQPAVKRCGRDGCAERGEKRAAGHVKAGHRSLPPSCLSSPSCHSCPT